MFFEEAGRFKNIPATNLATASFQPAGIKNPAWGGVPVLVKAVSPSGGSHVACLQTFRTLLDIEVDALSLCECLESVTDNGGKMYEDILTAVSWGDKAKSLGFVEPLDSACSH
jgi:hypothetical protein